MNLEYRKLEPMDEGSDDFLVLCFVLDGYPMEIVLEKEDDAYKPYGMLHDLKETREGDTCPLCGKGDYHECFEKDKMNELYQELIQLKPLRLQEIFNYPEAKQMTEK